MICIGKGTLDFCVDRGLGEARLEAWSLPRNSRPEMPVANSVRCSHPELREFMYLDGQRGQNICVYSVHSLLTKI